MDVEIILQRKFYLLNSEGRNLDVVACLRSFGRGVPTFSVTTQHGPLTRQDLSSVSADIRADLETLMSVHAADRDGVQMHAVANAVDCLLTANFSNAQKSLRDPATVKDLVQIYADVEAEMTKPGPQNPVVIRMKKIKDAAKLAMEARAAYTAGKADDLFGHLENAYLLALIKFDAVRKCNDAAIAKKVEGTRPERRVRIARFEKVYPSRKLEDVIKGGKTEFQVRATDVLRQGILTQAVEAYVKSVCAPVWKASAVKALEILSLPDFRFDGRPDPSVDPKTFVGFMNSNGIDFSAVWMGKSNVAPFRGSNEWSCEFKSADGKTFTVPFFIGDERRPTVGMVLESLQRDSASIAHQDKIDWMREMGYEGSVEKIRMGERIFDAIVRNNDGLKTFFGEDIYVSLLTEVGDDPPMVPEDFEPETASLAL